MEMAKIEPKRVFRELFPSDDLGGFKELSAHFMGKHDLAKQFIQPGEPWRFVVDTNQIIRQLLWATSTRRQADARTDLAEVVDSGLIRVYAPEQLREEVESKIPILSAEKGISEDSLRREWLAIQDKLIFEQVAGRKHKRGVRDPKDWPFVKLARNVRALGILTHDLDIPAMGAKLIPTKTLTKMRDYARATTVAVGSLVTVIFWAIIIGTLLAPIWFALRWVCKKLGPIGVFLVIVTVGLFIYFNDRLRGWLWGKMKALGGSVREGWTAVKPEVIATLDELAIQRSESRRLRAELEEELDLAPPRSLQAP